MPIMQSSPCWSEVTALLGGTFDPPHIGHREAARGLFRFPGIKQVFIIPSATPPHKSCFAEPVHRAAMAKLNFQSTPQDHYPAEIEIDLREIQSASTNSHHRNYTFNTLMEIRQETPHLAFVIGSDQLRDLHTWWRFPEILKLVHWIVLMRKPEGHTIAKEQMQKWEASNLAQKITERSSPSNDRTWRLMGGNTFLKLVPTDAPSLSSTQIREVIAKTGEPPAGSLLPEVWSYLKQNHLYGIY